MIYWYPVNLTAVHLVDFEISKEKCDLLKTTIGDIGLNGGSIFFMEKLKLSHFWQFFIIYKKSFKFLKYFGCEKIKGEIGLKNFKMDN